MSPRRAAAAILLACASLGAAPGCSMVLVNTVPTKPRTALLLGAPREALIEVLGPPARTDAAPFDGFDWDRAPGATPVRRDVYATSGLVRCRGEEYESDWNVYPAFLIVTLGLIEVVTLPRVIGDFVALSDECWAIYAWYDADDRLVGWGKRPIYAGCVDGESGDASDAR